MTPIYGNPWYYPIQIKNVLNQGRIYAIDEWGLVGIGALVIKAWRADSMTLGKVDAMTLGIFGARGFGKVDAMNLCEPFTLAPNDTINGYEIYFTFRYVYGLTLYTVNGNTYSCTGYSRESDSVIESKKEIFNPNFVFSGWSVGSDLWIDSIQLQFVCKNGMKCCISCGETISGNRTVFINEQVEYIYKANAPLTGYYSVYLVGYNLSDNTWLELKNVTGDIIQSQHTSNNAREIAVPSTVLDGDEYRFVIQNINTSRYYSVTLICLLPSQSPTLSPEAKIVIYNTNIQNVSSGVGQTYIIIVTCSSVTFIWILLYVVCCCINRIEAKHMAEKNKYCQIVRNPMVVSINIGDYINKNRLSEQDIEIPGICDDLLSINRDYENVQILCKKYNYDIYPKKLRTLWKANDLVDFVNQCAKRFSNNADKYDGLLVVVSSHGIHKQIITSDYRLISHTALHRFFSYQNVRHIPRVFILDCCDGYREKETDRCDKSKTVAIDEGEFKYDLRNEWKGNEHNPDYKLCTINAANEGYIAKMNVLDGSYLIYNIVKKMTQNNNNNKQVFFGEMIDEIDDLLHATGKQKIIATFNNQTRHLKFEMNEHNDNKSEGKQENEVIIDVELDQQVKKRVEMTAFGTDNIEVETNNVLKTHDG
eukprot:95424_1